MKFGIRLRTERKKKKLTAQTLADSCGVARSYISLIESGRRMPGRKTIPKMAAALHLPIHDIVNWYLEDVREKLL